MEKKKMAEKGGGKGYSSFPPSKGGLKSSLKSATPPSSLKGKDDTSSKKRGRKSKVNFEDALEDVIGSISKSLGKGDVPTSKANGSKGGKGASTVNGGTGKASVPKEPPKLELESRMIRQILASKTKYKSYFLNDWKREAELPDNAKCLMDCEAAQILESIQEQMVMLSEDPTIKIPISFDKGLKYAKTGDHYTNSQSVRRVLETLKKHGVSDGEICMIANICAETVDEVFALVPSLKPKRSTLREPIIDVLKELAKLKHSTQSPDIF